MECLTILRIQIESTTSGMLSSNSSKLIRKLQKVISISGKVQDEWLYLSVETGQNLYSSMRQSSSSSPSKGCLHDVSRLSESDSACSVTFRFCRICFYPQLCNNTIFRKNSSKKPFRGEIFNFGISDQLYFSHISSKSIMRFFSC